MLDHTTKQYKHDYLALPANAEQNVEHRNSTLQSAHRKLYRGAVVQLSLAQ